MLKNSSCPSLAPFVVTGCTDEDSITNQLHDYANHVSISQQPQQLAGKVAMPYSVVGCCEIDNTAPVFLSENVSSMS